MDFDIEASISTPGPKRCGTRDADQDQRQLSEEWVRGCWGLAVYSVVCTKCITSFLDVKTRPSFVVVVLKSFQRANQLI